MYSRDFRVAPPSVVAQVAMQHGAYAGQLNYQRISGKPRAVAERNN
jgi:hypothetical protein